MLRSEISPLFGLDSLEVFNPLEVFDLLEVFAPKTFNGSSPVERDISPVRTYVITDDLTHNIKVSCKLKSLYAQELSLFIPINCKGNFN